MTRSFWLLSAGLIAALVFSPALWAEQPEAPKKGRLAPGFDVAALDGNSISLKKLSGRVVLINFWASWCAPCAAEIPDLVSLQAAMPVTQFTVVAFSEDDEREDVTAFLKKQPVNFPVVFDEAQQVSGRYKVRGLPQTYLVGPDGKVVEIVLGPIDSDGGAWLAKIRKLLK